MFFSFLVNLLFEVGGINVLRFGGYIYDGEKLGLVSFKSTL